MKTFLTEKHNIPEGATHYLDESDEWNFLWLKNCPKSGWRKCSSSGDLGPIWVEADLIDRIKPIPQTKEVEWENGLPPVGEECEWRFKDEKHGEFSACKVLMFGSQVVFIKSHRTINGYKEFALPKCGVEFRKPETEEQRKEREELEAAYDLYCEWNKLLGHAAIRHISTFKDDDNYALFRFFVAHSKNLI